MREVWKISSLNPFEVREVLQEPTTHGGRFFNSLNPFEVREVLQVKAEHELNSLRSLNPFEVREVLQGIRIGVYCFKPSLNPFEVREVLQETAMVNMVFWFVSIPLKSGRCCKLMNTEVQKLTWSQSL